MKNFFIFSPIFFAVRFNEIDLLYRSLIGFVSFSLVASSIYILNDYLDIENDKKHPNKRFRPLASGEISKQHGILLMLIFVLAGLFLISIFSYSGLGLLSVYILLNIAYSIHLKHIAIVDIIIIAIGFVLRLFVGSVVTGVPLSSWIVIMTFLLALFLALAKRRDDVLIFLNTGKKMRRVVDGYNLKFLDSAMSIMAAVVIVSYVLYTTSPEVIERMHTNYVYLTSLFVIMGIMRYLKISFVHEDSGSPTRVVLRDSFMQLILLGWGASFVLILYLW